MKLAGLLFLSLLIFAATCVCAEDQKVPADKPYTDFPLGVYLPWEYTFVNSEINKMDHWEYVKKTLQTLKSQNVDTIWLVNIGLSDLKKLLQISIPMGFKLTPGLGEIEPRSHRWTIDPADPSTLEAPRQYYKTTTAQIMDYLGEDRKGIACWILGDEPTGNSIILLDIIRECFKEADPEHPSMSVNMWPNTQEITQKTKLTTFCVDLYPFFSAKNPNGPNTPAASKNFYTVNAQRMVEEAGRDGRAAWIMGQCFSEIWGPYDADSKGNIYALPGSFAHWRVPTVPEMRWQVWEAIRCGAKGFVFFTVFFSSTPNLSAKPVESGNLQDILIRKKTKLGVVCLLDAQANPTHQMQEAGRVYARLKPYKKLLSSLKISSTEWIQGNDVVKTGSFLDPSSGNYYTVIVNSDLIRTRKVNLVVGPSVKEVWNAMNGERIETKPLGWDGGNSEISVRLEAGDGMILKVIPK